MNETNYGNFAEPKETACSKRSEEVLLTALDKIEQLEKRKTKDEKLIQELFETVWRLLKVVRMSCSQDCVFCSRGDSFSVAEVHDKALKLCLDNMRYIDKGKDFLKNDTK